MTRTLITLAIASILATGCGHAALGPQAAASPAAPEHVAAKAAEKDDNDAGKDKAADAKAKAAPASEAAAKAAPAEGARKPGDFVVYRFSGSYRKEPLTLTQRVIERSGAVLTIDVTAEAGDEKRALRVKLNDAPGAKNEVLSVAEIVDGVEKPASLDAYDALLAEATLAADQNEAVLGAEDVLVDIGGAPLPCHKTSYRVRFGKKLATLNTLESDSFAWGDVGGDITTESGKLLYRVEVVEAGHADPAKGPAVAKADGER